MLKKRESSVRTGLIWPIIFLFFIVLGLFSFSIFKEMKKKNEVSGEINLLKQEAEKIKKANMNLEERILYLGSKDYQEVQAKEKLNLQSPDEKLIIINQDLIKKEEVVPPEDAPAILEKEKTPNFIKWLNYFFSAKI